MAEILPEQVDTQLAAKKGKEASAGPSEEKREDTSQKLPKGVVLDKEGKPYVT